MEDMAEEIKGNTEEFKRYYNHGFHGIDKKFRPIYWERSGNFDADKLIEKFGFDWIIKYGCQLAEDRMRWRLPICSEIAGKRIETVTIV